MRPAPKGSYRDHPRACGEHSWLRCIRPSSPGSSPRMRGTRHHGLRRHTRPGIIPAHAGNTLPTCRLLPIIRDHPRACGEHSSSVGADAPSPGSSPRMRGTPFGCLWKFSHPGIIPAHAGNTSRRTTSRLTSRDHPRACGEHLGELYDYSCEEGSSPRMRGTPSFVLYADCRVGIIPAHAGNTSFLTNTTPPPRNHPRACGEH